MKNSRQLFVGWRYGALIGSLVGVLGLALYPVTIYPMMHIEDYKEIQKKTRKDIKQEEVQPGGMKVWSDPFERK